MIPVKEGAEFNQLGQSSLAHFQTCWKEIKLLIMDEKSITGRSQVRDRWIVNYVKLIPQEADEILGLLFQHFSIIRFCFFLPYVSHDHIVQVSVHWPHVLAEFSLLFWSNVVPELSREKCIIIRNSRVSLTINSTSSDRLLKRPKQTFCMESCMIT